MGFYEQHVVPRCADFMLSRRQILALRERVVPKVAGEVLEIGFGSGLNVPYYGANVTKVHAIDPSLVGRKLATKRLAAATIPIEFSGLDGQALPLPDASVDAVLSTFTMCTIPDLARALREVRRVLKPGGTLHFLEHGRSPDSGVARWQDRLTPLNARIAGGCTLNRPIDRFIADAGFEITALQNFYLPGPKAAGHMYEGQARPA